MDLLRSRSLETLVTLLRRLLSLCRRTDRALSPHLSSRTPLSNVLPNGEERKEQTDTNHEWDGPSRQLSSCHFLTSDFPCPLEQKALSTARGIGSILSSSEKPVKQKEQYGWPPSQVVATVSLCLQRAVSQRHPRPGTCRMPESPRSCQWYRQLAVLTSLVSPNERPNQETYLR